jgi:putative ABC transport system ATP-binding protein
MVEPLTRSDRVRGETLSPDTPAADAILVEGLRHLVRDRVILNVDSWKVSPSGRSLVLGPSGSGKTTLLQLVAGFALPTAGRVRVLGRDLRAMRESERDTFRGRHIGFVFQTLHLVRALSVLDNLRLAAFLAGREQRNEELVALLDSVGLASRAGARPWALSQGEAQRVAIARALVNRPRLVLADEPTSALDDRNAQTVIDLLLARTAEAGAALVVATHDARILPRFEHRLILGRGA